jgi:hypothetical protein
VSRVGRISEERVRGREEDPRRTGVLQQLLHERDIVEPGALLEGVIGETPDRNPEHRGQPGLRFVAVSSLSM